MRGPKDGNFDSEGQRPSGLKPTSSQRAEESLVETAPSTSETIRMQAAEVEPAGARGAPAARSSQGGVSPARRARAAAGGDDRNLEHLSLEFT